MSNFPFYQQFSAEMIVEQGAIDELFVDNIANQLIQELHLNVVAVEKHIFPRHGLTKVWILSQSHLIIHSWPENKALHFDLITCSQNTNKFVLEKVLKSYHPDWLLLAKHR